MTFARAALQVRIFFVIHIVQQTDRFPKIDIFAAKLRKMFHRIGDRVAMFAQAFGFHPFVENC